MISHNFRRQRRGSFCIRAYTASSDRCVAARVTRFPISFSSFPLIASFLEYHPDCESAWHLYIQFLSTLHAGRVAATSYGSPATEVVTMYQYPPCGSSRCNFMSGFSVSTCLIFQYPPCGSSRCNFFVTPSPNIFIMFFQYPPCGSSRCNDSGGDVPISGSASFSTLHAGRVAATRLCQHPLSSL